MIKSIVFDIGGVVIKEDAEKARDILCDKFGINNFYFKKYTLDNLAKSYRGELHYNDFFKGLVRELNLDKSHTDLVNEWVSAREKTSKLNQKIVDLITELKKRNFVLGCLSNTTYLNDRVDIRKNIYELFNIKVLSNKIGIMKPEHNIYKNLLNRLKGNGINPFEVLYIDNEEQNLIPARQLGMNAIRFENPAKLRKELIKLNILEK